MNNSNVLISSCKGHTGHLLGTAGAIESIFTILSCYHARCPSTLNYQKENDNIDESLLLNIISHNETISWKSQKRIALKNSFGFGGTNSCLILSNLF